MSAGPTNRAVTFAHAEADPLEVVRQTMREQGCVCGDQLRVERHDPPAEVLADAEQFDVDVVSHVLIGHLSHCPVLARTATN